MYRKVRSTSSKLLRLMTKNSTLFSFLSVATAASLLRLFPAEEGDALFPSRMADII